MLAGHPTKAPVTNTCAALGALLLVVWGL